ncbi:MAG: gliding motility lipoprotein GldJ [Bacteroidetes bacterium]|nr:gliding motility lipoprotein GldJ [Bacteroidota bacterium]
MIRYNRIVSLMALLGLVILISSCRKEASRTTGWNYNDNKNGGFQVNSYQEQQSGPGLIFVEGGTFVMGQTEDDVMYNWDNIPRRVTVASFYMDETEVRNLDYVEYLYWLQRIFGKDYPGVYRRALPDTLVWRNKLAYNEPLVEYYLRHPAYREYPVVGVSWVQASDYCAWRSDRVNEMLLVREGILLFDPDQTPLDNFNTDAYLNGQYAGLVNKPLEDLNPSGTGTRSVRMEDGILLPKYRLPTEAEWEYAAYGLIGNTLYERVVERRIYPWNGNFTRSSESRYYGTFMDNFERGRGDYMGVSGNLNDGSDIPAPCGSFFPNDYGLYNMAGNVAEWVLDVYRPLTFEDVSDFRPFRGNVFKTYEKNAQGFLEQKDSLGRIRMRDVTVEESANRRNYRKADNINFLDGDFQSNIEQDWKNEPENVNSTNLMYQYGASSLISDNVRVYKGGSWRDKAYFMNPSTRRYLEENLATDFIGFRCAMTRVGSNIAGR